MKAPRNNAEAAGTFATCSTSFLRLHGRAQRALRQPPPARPAGQEPACSPVPHYCTILLEPLAASKARSRLHRAALHFSLCPAFPAALLALPSHIDTASSVCRSSRRLLTPPAPVCQTRHRSPCGLIRRHSPQPATSNVAVHNAAHRGRCGPAVACRPHVRRRGLAGARGECSPRLLHCPLAWPMPLADTALHVPPAACPRVATHGLPPRRPAPALRVGMCPTNCQPTFTALPCPALPPPPCRRRPSPPAARSA